MIEAPIDAIAGEVINVATGVDISVADIAAMVLDVARQAAPTSCVQRPRAASARSTATSARPRRRSGCSAGGPARRFEEGLERTVAWYRDNEAWWRAILARETRAFSS